jgi:hypothetical protein
MTAEQYIVEIIANPDNIEKLFNKLSQKQVKRMREALEEIMKESK